MDPFLEIIQVAFSGRENLNMVNFCIEVPHQRSLQIQQSALHLQILNFYVNLTDRSKIQSLTDG